MISVTNKFIYTHIPKCGGTSILRQIRPYLDNFDNPYKDTRGYGDHSFFHETFDVLSEEQLKEYYSFTVVRNTFDRIASFFQFLDFKT